MKIAVLSDIHANLTALNAVLGDIKKENCDRIICLGDIVLAGPQPKETLDFVREQPDWIIIQGNTDKLIADYGDEVLAMMRENFPIMANAIVDDVAQLSDEDKEYLRNLPPDMFLEFEGVDTLLVHGSPRANNENIMPNMPVEAVEEMIADTEANLILCGHTHIPCGYQTNKKQTVVNVGSVGRPMTSNPLACYVLINFENGNFEIKHKFVSYDKYAAADIVKARPFEGAETLADLLINPVTRHV